jgi:hypothetical protein
MPFIFSHLRAMAHGRDPDPDEAAQIGLDTPRASFSDGHAPFLSGDAMIRRVLLSLLVFPAVGSCVGKDCTTIGCFDGLEISLTPPLEGGTVKVQTEGGLSVTCTQHSSATLGDCYESGVEFDRDSAGRLAEIRFDREHPSDITVHVYQDNVLRRQVSAHGIEYATEQPNGPGCGPTCRAASLTAGVP